MPDAIRSLPLLVHLDGVDDPVEVTAIAPDIIRWERATGRKVSDLADGVGMDDLARLAFHALTRTGQIDPPAKYDRWFDTVAWVADLDPDEPTDPTRPGR